MRITLVGLSVRFDYKIVNSIQLKQHAAENFGLQLTQTHLDAFERYAARLVEWNERINLTAITDEEGVRVRHLLDSLSVCQAVTLEPGMRVIDVGTGAGLPGLPLHIVIPGLHTVLMEATGKKLRFLDHVIAELKLENMHTLHARAEDAGQNPDHRQCYDRVLARSVARLPALAEYLLPLAKIGGQCVAMKGTTAHSEVDDALNAIETLGGAVHSIEAVDLPGVDDTHYLIVIEKRTPTPRTYPRSPGTPTRKPIT